VLAGVFVTYPVEVLEHLPPPLGVLLLVVAAIIAAAGVVKREEPPGCGEAVVEPEPAVAADEAVTV